MYKRAVFHIPENTLKKFLKANFSALSSPNSFESRSKKSGMTDGFLRYGFCGIPSKSLPIARQSSPPAFTIALA